MLKANEVAENSDQTRWQKYASNNYLRVAVGAIVGVVAGYFYWKYIGCTSGTCPLTSDPYKSMGWFGLIGGLWFHKKKD